MKSNFIFRASRAKNICTSGVDSLDKISFMCYFASWSAGWGAQDVNQKVYVECFCSDQTFQALLDKCKAFSSLADMDLDQEGSRVSNIGNTDVNAVRWGVFPSKEIIQLTSFLASSYIVWKDEAFEIWHKGWAQLYTEDDSLFLKKIARRG